MLLEAPVSALPWYEHARLLAAPRAVLPSSWMWLASSQTGILDGECRCVLFGQGIAEKMKLHDTFLCTFQETNAVLEHQGMALSACTLFSLQ